MCPAKGIMVLTTESSKFMDAYCPISNRRTHRDIFNEFPRSSQCPGCSQDWPRPVQIAAQSNRTENQLELLPHNPHPRTKHQSNAFAHDPRTKHQSDSDSRAKHQSDAFARDSHTKHQSHEPARDSRTKHQSYEPARDSHTKHQSHEPARDSRTKHQSYEPARDSRTKSPSDNSDDPFLSSRTTGPSQSFPQHIRPKLQSQTPSQTISIGSKSNAFTTSIYPATNPTPSYKQNIDPKNSSIPVPIEKQRIDRITKNIKKSQQKLTVAKKARADAVQKPHLVINIQVNVWETPCTYENHNPIFYGKAKRLFQLVFGEFICSELALAEREQDWLYTIVRPKVKPFFLDYFDLNAYRMEVVAKINAKELIHLPEEPKSGIFDRTMNDLIGIKGYFCPKSTTTPRTTIPVQVWKCEPLPNKQSSKPALPVEPAYDPMDDNTYLNFDNEDLEASSVPLYENTVQRQSENQQLYGTQTNEMLNNEDQEAYDGEDEKLYDDETQLSYDKPEQQLYPNLSTAQLSTLDNSRTKRPHSLSSPIQTQKKAKVSSQLPLVPDITNRHTIVISSSSESEDLYDYIRRTAKERARQKQIDNQVVRTDSQLIKQEQVDDQVFRTAHQPAEQQQVDDQVSRTAHQPA
ncbi:hypothetical protein F5Y14DRAFT_407705, partial [Nemania sp. NC0429]